ncbi:MAG TPA: hypothetical protein VGN08_11335 [Solirubrobacteraceae bacterium]|jgi:hypothetical protein
MHAVAGLRPNGALLGSAATGADEELRRRRGLELTACAVALGLLALVMSAGHIRAGGFYYDDWSLLALARFPGHAGTLHGLWLDYGQRPGQVLYYAALGGTLGGSSSARLALASATLVLEVTCLYALLRRLGLAARHAVAIAALVLVFPFSDSIWLWGVLSLSSLAIAIYLVGAMLALRALQSSGPRALALHGASLALFVTSVASYEVVAVAAGLTGLLYVRQLGMRRARGRWTLDVIAVALTLLTTRALLPIDVATPSRMQSLSGLISHGGLIAVRGARLIGAAAVPLPGLDPWIGAAALVAVLATATWLRCRLGPEEQLRAELGRWLAVAGAGALVAIAGWSVYVPATDHYAPTLGGTVNRMNAGAAIGVALLVYAAVVLLVRMLGRRLTLSSASAAALTGAIAALLLAGYLNRAAGDARAWDRAAADQRAELADLHAGLPRPPATATVFAFDAPSRVALGVPVLSSALDLTSALRISYSSPGLLAAPLAGAAGLSCRADGPVAGGVAGAYGLAYLVDVRRRSAALLTAPRQCAALRRSAAGAAGRS